MLFVYRELGTEMLSLHVSTGYGLCSGRHQFSQTTDTYTKRKNSINIRMKFVVLKDKALYSVTDAYQYLGEPAASTDCEDAPFREGLCTTSDGCTPASGFDPKTMCDL
jgi:hypothetical protein